MDKQASYKDLKTVPTKDCREALTCIEDNMTDLICQPLNDDMFKYTRDRIFVRQGCLDRLKTASKNLQSKLPGAKLVIVYGYRHPKIQKKYFDNQCKRFKEFKKDLLEQVHKLIAVPEVAGHPTGGAVDVTIQLNDVNLDMGTEIADFSNPKILPTFSSSITETQKANRLLLRSIMMQAGFAPFNGEWWHFSYGDKEWAYYYLYPFAIYDQLNFTFDLE